MTDIITTCQPVASGGPATFISNGEQSLIIRPHQMMPELNREMRVGGSFSALNSLLNGPFYAGIGSRKTPTTVLLEMQAIGVQLALRGYVLRSGMADGADSAFEKGCKIVAGRHVLRGKTTSERAMEHAARFHPAWDNCNDTARALHARNSQIMLGDNLDLPVKFVVCWTPEGMVTGGTGQALRIAHAESIPVFNLAVVTQASLWAWLDQGRIV